MKHRTIVRALVAAVALSAAPAFAHCDGLDGPVVGAARRAIETGNVNHVLVWVQPKDAAAIEDAFRMTRAVRKLGPEAQRIADNSFFEALVRVHRAGEGEPFTGLKPAGRDLGPAIPAADRALDSGELKPVEELLTQTMRHSLHGRFEAAAAKRSFAVDDVAAGREYVAAYVEYIHAVERMYESAGAPAHAHGH